MSKKLREFLGGLEMYKVNIRPHVRDGLQEALEAFDQFFKELVPTWNAKKADEPEQVEC